LTPKDGNDILSRHISNKLRIHTAENPRSYFFCSRSLKLCNLNERADKLCGTEVWRVQEFSVAILGK